MVKQLRSWQREWGCIAVCVHHSRSRSSEWDIKWAGKTCSQRLATPPSSDSLSSARP